MTQEKTPVKYTMGIWKALPTYPSKMDVLYEIYSYLYKSGKSDFSESTLNSIWFDDKGSGNWKGTRHEMHFIDLQKESYIKHSKEVNGKQWFVIDKNPFA